MGKKGISREEYKQIKSVLKENPKKTIKEIAKEVKFGYSTVVKIKNSKNYKEYREKYCKVKTPQEKLEEFLKNPNTDESLEKLVESFLEDRRPVKKQKVSFWEKLKRHFNR